MMEQDSAVAQSATKTPTDAPDGELIDWSVVIPFYNEEAYLRRTLETLAAQSLRPFRLILVNNGSTDKSVEIAENFARDMAVRADGLRVEVVHEDTPGQAAALEHGIGLVTTPFTAICDADTIYPPTYLATAHEMFAKKPAAVAAIAIGTGAPSGRSHWLARIKGRVVSSLLARQCHGGGYAHSFRTDVLKMSGGYSRKLWPYCLKDHELMHRISKLGPLAYSFAHWCHASDRRDSRANVRWSLYERIMYHVTPFAKKDWFFYRFLAPRFDARSLSELNLRERNFDQ